MILIVCVLKIQFDSHRVCAKNLVFACSATVSLVQDTSNGPHLYQRTYPSISWLTLILIREELLVFQGPPEKTKLTRPKEKTVHAFIAENIITDPTYAVQKRRRYLGINEKKKIIEGGEETVEFSINS